MEKSLLKLLKEEDAIVDLLEEEKNNENEAEKDTNIKIYENALKETRAELAKYFCELDKLKKQYIMSTSKPTH